MELYCVLRATEYIVVRDFVLYVMYPGIGQLLFLTILPIVYGVRSNQCNIITRPILLEKQAGKPGERHTSTSCELPPQRDPWKVSLHAITARPHCFTSGSSA